MAHQRTRQKKSYQLFGCGFLYSRAALFFFRPYQKETETMMNFIKKNPFVLSGNFQGGEIVASYPFDNADSTKEQGAVSLTSDNDIFEKLAKDYAQRNKMMAPGNGCDKSFPHGIANGNSWNKKRGSK